MLERNLVCKAKKYMGAMPYQAALRKQEEEDHAEAAQLQAQQALQAMYATDGPRFVDQYGPR